MKPQTGPLVVLVAGIFAACGGGESRWSGTITDSAGVTIVSNTDVGMWVPGEEWTVEEELRIGAVEGPAEYEIGQVGSIAVDSKGRILVLDTQAQHIQVYSPDGAYEETIGARGGGPGELGYGMALLMGPGDTLLVPDRGNVRFNRYAPDGSDAGSIRLDPEAGWPMAFKSAAGAIVEQIRQFALPDQPAISNPMDLLVRLASDGSITDTLLSFPAGKAQTFDGQYHWFEPEPLWNLTDYSQIVLGVSDEYRIGIHADGQLERIIAKTFQRRPVSDGDIAAIFGELDRRWAAAGAPAERRQAWRGTHSYAEFLPAIMTVAVGPVSTIWVQHIRPPSELSVEEWGSVSLDQLEFLGAADWDVFDGEGRFLGVVTMPERFTPSVFSDDRIYGVWRDELNVEYVLRLSIIGDLDVGTT